jgi:GT2 family glycosyltransferase
MIGSNVASKVAVVTVTYGQRSTYVRTLLSGLGSGSVRPASCIIVDNGSHEDLNVLCTVDFSPIHVLVLHQGCNTGSAAGFAAGIRRALEMGYTYVWLLDDDNVPEPEALATLMTHLQREGEADAQTCLAALRLDRTKYLRAATGERTMAFSEPDSFMGFSLATSLCRRLLRPELTVTPQNEVSAEVLQQIDVAIYGGLVLPAAAVKAVGLPDERYFLYFDDREYTTRLTRAGFQIKLVPKARIRDLEDSWETNKAKKIPWVFNPTSSSLKVFYMVRNGVHYDRCFVVRYPVIYLFNAVVYFMALSLGALRCGVGPLELWRRLGLVWRAFSDGWHGRLGKAISIHL